MPFESLAQEGWAHSHPDEFGRKNLAEWDRETKGKHLPDKKKKGPKHGMKHTHIEHHSDGSHTVKHSMHDGTEQGSAHADDGAMMEHMDGMLESSAPAPAEPGAAPAPPMA